MSLTKTRKKDTFHSLQMSVTYIRPHIKPNRPVPFPVVCFTIATTFFWWYVKTLLNHGTTMARDGWGPSRKSTQNFFSMSRTCPAARCQSVLPAAPEMRSFLFLPLLFFIRSAFSSFSQPFCAVPARAQWNQQTRAQHLVKLICEAFPSKGGKGETKSSYTPSRVLAN